MAATNDIQIISAASILGLKPTGVEKLAETFLHAGLAEKLDADLPVISIPLFNHLYSDERDHEAGCLNARAIVVFSEKLMRVIENSIDQNNFSFVLGGDCSILPGIMPALKRRGNYGLIFIDAHADLYLPHQSPTGEVADMDLAIVTGHGPELLTNIAGLKPYVREENVIHIGQRDAEEAAKYGATDLMHTAISCFDMDTIKRESIATISEKVVTKINDANFAGYWIHFDTDALTDEMNPAVDYRLPGGLEFSEIECLLQRLLRTGKIIGMTVTIYNPFLDSNGEVAKNIVQTLERAYRSNT